jgi:hypothetical protein
LIDYIDRSIAAVGVGVDEKWMAIMMATTATPI